MYSCKFAMCADSVIIDRGTNQISVINIIEQLQSHGFPLAILKFVAVFYLTRENNDNPTPDVLLRVDAENTTNTFPLDLNFGEKLKNRVVSTLEGVVMPGPGTLRVSLLIDGNSVGHWEFEVSLIQGAPQIQVEQG